MVEWQTMKSASSLFFIVVLIKNSFYIIIKLDSQRTGVLNQVICRRLCFFQIGFAFAVRQGGGITQTVCIGGESEAGFGI